MFSANQHEFLQRTHKNKGYLQSAASLQRFLTTASPDFHEADWHGILDLAKAYIADGHAADLTRLLDETLWESVPYGERWRPLREAVHAAAVGTSDALLDVAPEIRNPALEILKEIAPGVGERPPRKVPKRRPKRNRGFA
jgi:hypothetical protein